MWRARDEQLGRDVAVKLLHPHLFPDARSRERFAAEARAVAGVAHPAIVDVFDVDAFGDRPAIILELVPGVSLAARLQTGPPLLSEDAAGIAADVAEALFAAHKRGIVHRDVKPANVLLEPSGRARLVDFGIAHSLAQANERLTLTGEVVGTLRYMAPEQLADERIGPRADLFALGAVLYEMLSRRPAFSSRSPISALAERRAGPPPLDGVDQALAAIAMACLAIRPTDRPIHAGAVATALRAWLRGDSAPAVAVAPVPGGWAPRPVDRDAPTQTIAAPPAALSGGAVQRTGRRWTAALAGVVGVVILVGVIALGGATPTTGGAAATSPSAANTRIPAVAIPAAVASPTPSTAASQAQLLAQLRQHCGPGATVDLAGLSQRDAQKLVDRLAAKCDHATGEGGD